MPTIEEYDVVIKRISVADLKAIFGEGRKDIRVRFSWHDMNNSPRTLVHSGMEIIIETWEPKNAQNKSSKPSA